MLMKIVASVWQIQILFLDISENYFFSILNLQLFEPVDVEPTDMWDQFYSNDLWFKGFTHANLL